ncbi:hypothetical protein ACWDTT_06465 [Streptosporangium sandarakinum]
MPAGQVAEVRGQLALIVRQVAHRGGSTPCRPAWWPATTGWCRSGWTGIQAAAEERAGERARIQTMAGNARWFATWVSIVVSRVFGVLGIVLTTWA